MAEVGIISIATNSYFSYWLAMVKSAYEKIESPTLIDFYLFTDQVDLDSKVVEFSDRFRFTFVTIPSYGWPEATIKRYEIMDQHCDLLANRVLLYLDSDMLIRENFIPDLLERVKTNEMVLVLHPGFYRPNGPQLLIFYLRSPRFLVKDFLLKSRVGGLGSWENRIGSTAFVPRKKRTKYVCGGTWFGLNKTFISYVKILRKQVDLDDDNRIMAVWHDESHLNKLATEFKIAVSDPRYCFDPRFSNLRKLPNLIEAVNKNE
jgi:histo-blood group ABO system transferase